MLQDKIFKLKGKVMHYAWGGYDFIPAWLGVENKAHKPYAEYWMGAHPLASSEIETVNGNLSLQQLMKDHAETIIGNTVLKQFGELPYLFKILDVKDMLSIQVHPTKEEAAIGFDKEEAEGVSISAANRNYKDRNHKPEVMVALSEFWLLHGFLQPQLLKQVLAEVPEFAGFEKIFDEQGYKGLYKHVMEMPQENVTQLLLPLVEREIEKKKNGQLKKEEPGWWVSKLYEDTGTIELVDRGVFSIYFFNIVKTMPGDAVFQGAGIPHAYLEGQNVELMANSDNVLRGGLTPKHIDIPELLKHTSFEPVTPNIMRGDSRASGEKNYPCPVADFGIDGIELTKDQQYNCTSASLEIIVVIDGELLLKSSTKELELHKGEAAAIFANETYNISTLSGVRAYKAFVP